MRNVLVGLVAAIVIAAAGYFGFAFYVQHRAANEVEAAFERMRKAGETASHGKVSYNLWTRALTVADIEAKMPTQPAASVKIASLMASGLGQSGPDRFSADVIETTDADLSLTIGQDGSQIQYTYKVPKLTVTDCSGPTQASPPPAASATDLYRFGIAQFARFTVSSIAIPVVSTVFKTDAPLPAGGDITYSGIAIDSIKDGKIASAKVDKATLTYSVQAAGKADQFTGTLENLVAQDIDLAAAASMLDPRENSDDHYYRVYGHASTGAYDVTSRSGLHMRFDRMALDDVKVRPSRVQLPAILAAIPPAGTPPAPAQTREMLEKIAGLYEGLKIGNFEISGISIDTPQGLAKLATIRFNLDNGKSEIGFEGLDVGTPKGPFKVGRFALKSFDIANFLRTAALFSNPAQRPAPDQALRMLTVLGGAEVKGVVAPFKTTNRQVKIDNISLDWGQFVGPIPSKAHLLATMATPVDVTDPSQRQLIAAGLDTIAIDADIGAAWTEASGAFVLDPASIELGGVGKLSARIALANVPRAVFSPDPRQASAMAAQIEAGTLAITLHDTGAVDLLVAQYARTHRFSADDARRAIVDEIKAGLAPSTNPNPNPDAVAIADALARLVENPRGTLSLKLTPRAKVPALQLVQLLKTQPLDALAQFQVEASTRP